MHLRDNAGAELRLPLWPVLIAQLLVGLAVALAQDFLTAPDWLHSVILSTTLCVLAAAEWRIDLWKPMVARWIAVIAWAVWAYLAHTYFSHLGFLALLALSPLLALPLIGFSASLVTAVGESLALAVLLSLGCGRLTLPAVLIAVLMIWAGLGAEVAVYWPTQRMLLWYDDYFGRATCDLEQARGQHVALKESLANLEHANYQLAQASERIAALRSVAEDARKSKALFVARVSHELRTPLNMIVGLVELMVESPEIYTVDLPPQMERDLEVVLSNSRHLSSLVDDVLDLTRTEEGRMTLHKEWVNLADIAQEAAEAVQPLVHQKGLILDVCMPEALPEVYCDRTRIRQVLLNLVSNAARFTEQGGITVELRARHPYVVTVVRDTGPGISPEDAREIFQPFSQGTGDVWRDKGGSGLGLAISQQFVRLHEGRLWLESERGVGSSFFFELPISHRAAHGAVPGHQIRGDWVWREDRFESARTAMPIQTGRSHIVVWDEARGLLPVLSRYGDEVSLASAQSLAEACEMVGELAGGILMINATTLDNLSTYLRETEGRSLRAPVIFSSLPAYDAQAVLRGAAGYLIKPVSRNGLETVLQSIGKTVKRVLIVDDDPNVLDLLERMLGVCNAGLEIQAACNGEQALEVLRCDSIDVVFLDVVMPRMSGWQVLEEITADEAYGNPAVIMVSAQDPSDAHEMVTPLAVTSGHGLSVRRFLCCAAELAAILQKPERELHPMPPQIDAERAVS
ncbi:MAG: hybrid sensor histidine kinase/response regulator [Chloroflexi bacterium]|nr:hybrid sensor histidine kinase/response regulator [Chloroflexota bacterium]